MAEKFPVGEAVNETLQFVLNRWGTVLRFGWAPVVAALSISFGLVYAILDLEALEALDNNPNAAFSFDQFLRVSVPAAMLVGAAGSLLIGLVMAGFMASVYRLVALGEERPGFVHIRFDGPALRVFIANFILSLISFLIYAAAFLIASLATGVSVFDAFGAVGDFFRMVSEAAETGVEPDPASLGETLAPLSLFAVAGLFAFLPFIYVNVRLAPFLSGSAAENRLLLVGAWRLTAGRFWGVFFFYILLFFLLFAVLFVFQLAIGIFDALSALPAGGMFSVISAISAGLSLILTVAYQLIASGLQFAAQGVVYRRLKTGA